MVLAGPTIWYLAAVQLLVMLDVCIDHHRAFEPTKCIILREELSNLGGDCARIPLCVDPNGLKPVRVKIIIVMEAESVLGLVCIFTFHSVELALSLVGISRPGLVHVGHCFVRGELGSRRDR